MYASQASARVSTWSDIERMQADDNMQIDTAIQQLQRNPNSAQAQTQIARLQQQRRRLQDKTRGLDSLSLTSDVPPFISLALGSAYFRATRFADAERQFKETIRVDPKL